MEELKEMDQKGKEILESIKIANEFNRWMYDTIRPYLGSKVFEIGSGIGNISEIFLSNNDGEIMLSDLNPQYCNLLKKKFGKNNQCLGVESIDLTSVDFEKKYSGYFNKFDTVFALNVIEHISDDKLALNNAKLLLKESGNLIILVPSYMFLYNDVDKELGHYRRYTVNSLKKVFMDNGLNVIHSQYFNFAGMPGWYVNGRILKNDSISKSKMKLYNKMVPFFKLTDQIIRNKMGLSTIVIGKKINQFE